MVSSMSFRKTLEYVVAVLKILHNPKNVHESRYVSINQKSSRPHLHLHIHEGNTRPFFQRHLHFNRCLRTAKSNPNVPFNCNGHMQGGLRQPHLSRPQSWHKQSQGFLVLEHTRFILQITPIAHAKKWMLRRRRAWVEHIYHWHSRGALCTCTSSIFNDQNTLGSMAYK